MSDICIVWANVHIAIVWTDGPRIARIVRELRYWNLLVAHNPLKNEHVEENRTR